MLRDRRPRIMMFQLCLALLAGLLMIGVAIDVASRRLPNWLTSAVAALYGIYVVVSPVPVDWIGAFLVAGAVFAIGFALFALNWLGGGDVKLMAGLALWAGVEQLALFLVVTSLAGGLLSIVFLVRRWLLASPYLPLLLWPVYAILTPGGTDPESTVDEPVSTMRGARTGTTESLPYGVAIAAGGLVVIHSLLQL